MSSSSSDTRIKHDTTLVWSKMVGYARADGYMNRNKSCGSCIHYSKADQLRVGGFVGLGNCGLHDFIPFTSQLNVCDSYEKPDE